MTSNAERLIAQTLEQAAPKDSPDIYHQTETAPSKQRSASEQPNWDVPSLFQLDQRQGTNKPADGAKITTQFQQPAPQKEQLPAQEETPHTITYTSPFASPQRNTYNSPYAPIPLQIKPERTTVEILDKPLTELNREDFDDIRKNLTGALGTVDSDFAGMAGLYTRFKTEFIAHKFPTNTSAIYGLSAVALTGLSAYALKSDVENFYNSTSTAGKIHNGVASALDATALAGSLMAVFPRTRAVGTPIAALSFFARAGVGVGSKIYDGVSGKK